MDPVAQLDLEESYRMMLDVDLGAQSANRTVRAVQWKPNVKIYDKVAKYGEAAEAAVRAMVYRVAQEARDKARAAAPKDTGAMAASIYVTNPGSGRSTDDAGLVPKSRSIGYWRAINAASRRRPSLEVSRDKTLVSSVRRQVRVSNDFNQPADYSFQPMAMSGPSRFFVAVGVAVYYAGYVEFGTVRMPARPFFTPAMQWAQAEVLKRLPATVQTAVVASRGGRGA